MSTKVERRAETLARLDELKAAGLITYTASNGIDFSSGVGTSQPHLEVFATGKRCDQATFCALSDEARLMWTILDARQLAAREYSR